MTTQLNPGFFALLQRCFARIHEEDAGGCIISIKHGVATTATPGEIDLESIEDAEIVIFDGGNSSGDQWKYVFHIPLQICHYFNENPLPTKGPAISVSLDGGETFCPAPQGVRVCYDNLEFIHKEEEVTGSLQLNATHEGLIQDVWVVDGELDVLLGGTAHTLNELVSVAE